MYRSIMLEGIRSRKPTGTSVPKSLNNFTRKGVRGQPVVFLG